MVQWAIRKHKTPTVEFTAKIQDLNQAESKIAARAIASDDVPASFMFFPCPG
jgi:hypothetical protein